MHIACLFSLLNSCQKAPYVFAEYLHPTAWVGQQAVDWISNASKTVPWFLKISFHRPHSPYDPPVRVLNATKASDLPTVQLAVDGWDNVFRGGADDPPGCGPVGAPRGPLHAGHSTVALGGPLHGGCSTGVAP